MRTTADHDIIARHLPELINLEAMMDKLQNYGRIQTEVVVDHAGLKLPIYSLEFGPNDPTSPVIVFVGGVHGLERIGSRVVIEYLRSFRELLTWDIMLEAFLERCRVLFIPILNPAGIFDKTRSNANGVDLMRNAPIEADHKPNVRLVCGHRISPKLPWYRGKLGEPMEIESQTLFRVMQQRIFPSRFALSLDVHSGFGRIDRLWFPFAFSRRTFPNYAEVFALKRKLDQTLPNHVYVLEPQSLQYVTHGDLWDYIYLKFREQNPESVYLPLTLEMGSWLWVRKNPRQLFNPLGVFNPLLPHRTKRILRRHMSLLDFLVRATGSFQKWVAPDHQKLQFYQTSALSAWYGQNQIKSDNQSS